MTYHCGDGRVFGNSEKQNNPWSWELCVAKRWILQWVNPRMQQMDRKMRDYRVQVNTCALRTHTWHLHSFSLICYSSWINRKALGVWLWNEAAYSNWELCPLWRSAGCRQQEWKMEQLTLTCLTMHKGADIAWCLSPPRSWVLTVWRWSSKLL